MKYSVLDRQSMFDIALQTAGSAEAAFALARENDLSLTEDLEVGAVLTMGQSILTMGQSVLTMGHAPLLNKNVTDFFANKHLRPATAISNTETHIVGRIFDYTFEEQFE
ncbi:MAG: hypothetical protein LBU90_10495 [Bacteroidales bacterium]|jgi:hypothetical protein|nr:hypothetical protein [Bacteroidales bacterium]